MKTFLSIVSVLFMSQVVMADGPMVNTVASVVQCQPILFTWQNGAPPYYLSLIPGGQPSAAPIMQFPTQNGNSFTWTVNLPAGTTFTTSLKDGSGAQAYSDIQTVQAGPESGCLSSSTSGTPSDAASPTMNPPSSTVNSATPAPATTPSTKAAALLTTSESGSSGSNSRSTSTATNTAGSTSANDAVSVQRSNVNGIGFAGVLGLVGAWFLG